nr:class I SAM-dependent methyltransferase [uncultured Roseococcus sp.]
MTNRSVFHRTNDIRRLPTFCIDRNLPISVNVLGTWAFASDDCPLLSRVKQYFGISDRPDLILKIWQYPVHSDDLSDVKWGRYFNINEEPGVNVDCAGNLVDSLEVQNFVSTFGYAPKILGLFVLQTPARSRHIAVLTEHPDRRGPVAVIPGGQAPNPEAIFASISKLAIEYDLVMPWQDVQTPNNFIGGKLIDWQHAKFGNKYLDFLRKFYLDNTQFGESKYQTAPALGITEGIRNSEQRISDLGLDRFEFQGASIFDIGCNGGQFLNYAASKGARYGIGADWPQVVKAADYFSNYLGHFNIRYHSAPLHKELPELSEKLFDYCLFLSMVTHVGVPDYLNDIARILVVEINHGHQVAAAVEKLGKYYWLVPWGKATDHGDRAIFHCYNRSVYPKAPMQQGWNL